LNPYQKWLGIPYKVKNPDHFQLLGITQEEVGKANITASAKKQIQKLKPHRKGKDAAVCKKVFEEIKLAHKVLADPQEREKYLLELQKDKPKKISPSDEMSDPVPKPDDDKSKAADSTTAKTNDKSETKPDDTDHGESEESDSNEKPAAEFEIPSVLRVSDEEWAELDESESPKPSKWKLILTAVGCLIGVGLVIAGMEYFSGPASNSNLRKSENGYDMSIWQSDAREFIPRDDFSDADEVASQTEFDSAIKHFNAKNYSAALPEFQAALRFAPDRASKLKVYEFLIPILEQNQDIDALIEAHRYVQDRTLGNNAIKLANANLFNSLELAHTNSDPFGWRGIRTSLRPKKNFIVGQVTIPYSTLEKLRSAFIKRLEKHPNHVPSLYGLITLYSTSVGLNPNAKDQLVMRLCAIREHQGEKLENETVLELVAALTRAGYHEKAAMVCQQVADDYNNSNGIWFRISEAECLSRTGQNERALAALTIALDWSRDLNSADRFGQLVRIGDLYLLLEKVSNAVMVYELAIKAGAESNAIQQADLMAVESKIQFVMQRSGS